MLANGIFPEAANPEAIPIMFCSAAPQSKNLSGNSLAKRVVIVDLFRSPPMTTIFGLPCPSSTKVLPNASRVATFVTKVSGKLLKREPELVGVGRFAVEGGVVLHEADALTLHRSGYDGVPLPVPLGSVA